ncbi:MAG TPA: GWxTD domain-containing protein [Bacteroidota bacterium]|nr:GWxTD domain-containing protein [Bacteroidota bacterium]
MPAPKTSVLLALLCAAGIAASQSIPGRSAFRLDADAARFSGPDSLTYVEVYYGISEASLTYLTDSAGYRGALEMKLQIAESARIVDSRQWVLPRVLRDTAELRAPKNILSFESLALPGGDYRLSLSCRDSLDPSRADSVVIPLRIAGFAARAEAMSDIELCSRITPSADRSSPFYRNTLEIIPNPSRLYGEGLPVIHFYAEVYNLNASTGPNVLLRASILDSYGREVVFQAKSKPRTHQSSAEYGSMNVASLPGGSYLLRVEVLDTTLRPHRSLAASEKKFFVFNPGVGKSDDAARPPRHDQLFSFMTEADADDEIRKLRYLSTEPEREQIEQLADLNARRNFLKNFWSGRNGDAAAGPGRAREEYLARIAEANEKYSERNREGWLTDRGRVLVIYGRPDDVERHPSMGESRPYETWEYRGIQGGVVFVFVDRLGFGGYRLVHSTHLNELRNENWYQEEASIR